MSLGNSIRHGAAWLFVGNTGGQLLSFIIGIVLARLLVPEDFGMLVTIQVFTGLAGFVAGGGMGQALVRAKEASKQDYDIVFTLQIIIGGLIYSGFFFAAPWFSRWYGNPLYADLLRVAALSFIFRPLVNLPNSILHRNMRYKEQVIVGITTQVVSGATSIVMAILGYGVWSLIIGGIAGSVTNMTLLIPLSKWRPGFSMEIRRGRDIARYGMLVSVTDILVYIRNQISVYILSRTLGPASVGLYNKGESLAKMPRIFVASPVYKVLFRAMALEQDNIDKCRYLFFRSITLVAVYTSPFYIGVLFLAEPLIRGVYGEKWLEAASPLFILSLAWPFWLLENLSGAVIAARNWLDREVLVQFSNIVVTGILVLIGLPYGIEGIAWGIVGSSVYNAIYMYWLANSCLQASWVGLVHALIPAVILNAMLALALFALDKALPLQIRNIDLYYILVMGAAGCFFYAACFLYLPISALSGETMRWKLKLRLKRVSGR